ncbi:MAG: dihydropteroate synthase [Methanophagales archaeon ANME-1-THS]|nr:MAG: dihydropteroate synthase [Methanophagales archaeon ANME-1-THS]
MKHLNLGPDQPAQVMGVINLSPESFYQGSYVPEDSVLEIAHQMVQDGAQILDIGARSTAPGVMPISKQEERERLIPVLKQVMGNVDCAISIDTMFSDIAEEALNLGADIINDISGLHVDERMVPVVAGSGCHVVLMASEKRPGDVIGMNAVLQALERIITFAESHGIDPTKIIVDPGVGRWIPEKVPLYDLELIDQFERLQIFGKPILAAVSRKSFIGAILKEPPENRLFGSLAATALAVYKGAKIIRTHDIKETRDVMRVAEALKPKRAASQRDDTQVEIIDVISPEDAVYCMRAIGTTEAGARIMKNKSVLKAIRISNLTTTEALIIKQEMLSKGGDAALPRDAISHEREKVDLIIFGTIVQIKRLIDKLQYQARTLPVIADLLRETLAKDHDLAYKYTVV